jgi:hypothetical protein
MTNNIRKVKEHKNKSDNDVITLSTGIRARFVPVPVWLIQEAQMEIKNPPVPMQEIEGKKHPQPNPQHPDYTEAVRDAERRRNSAALDVMALFGVELIDGIPEDGLWIRKLKWLEKRGQLNLSDFDFEDELDRSFLYVKFIAMGNSDWPKLARLNGITQEDLDAARELFRGEERSDSNSRSGRATKSQG